MFWWEVFISNFLYLYNLGDLLRQYDIPLSLSLGYIWVCGTLISAIDSIAVSSDGWLSYRDPLWNWNFLKIKVCLRIMWIYVILKVWRRWSFFVLRMPELAKFWQVNCSLIPSKLMPSWFWLFYLYAIILNLFI